MSRNEIAKEDLEPLWQLANSLAEDGEKAQNRHHRDTWQYGQGLGYEKAGDELSTRLRDLQAKIEEANESAERVQFTCKDCGKEVDRERHKMDIDGMTPVRCTSCTMERMAEP